MNLDATHDPGLQSWVTSANSAVTDFPIQNLPFARFRPRRGIAHSRIGVAIGDQVLDLRRVQEHGAADALSRGNELLGTALHALAEGDLNALMARPAPQRRLLRQALSEALCAGSGQQQALSACLLPQSDASFDVPCRIGDYTDFYTGIHHATTVGRLFRPDNPLLPNYKWVPIGYHGRASSIVCSGTAIHRPRGQVKWADALDPMVAATRRLDYELELAAFVATPNALGEPVQMEHAPGHLFGVALFNDWSARDLQAWEYQPLGPFLSKNFASTLSPWIVTMEALEPFHAPFTRPAGDPEPLPYLDSPQNRRAGALDITLEVLLETPQMRHFGLPPQRLSRSSFLDAYWTLAQLLAHHTVNGCNLETGDLLGSGTLSGPLPNQAGSLLELTEGGRTPIMLAHGEPRTFLEDGDRVILRGWCERAGARRIGFGECEGTVVAAR